MATSPGFTEAQLSELAGLAFDFLCTRRVTDFVSVDEIMAAIDPPLEAARVQRFQERFVRPQRARLIERAKKSSIKVGAWLPDAVRDEIAALAGQPAPLPPRIVDEAIASERVRDEVKAMLQDTLSSFITKATSGVSDATPSALRGALSRGAFNIASASKGLLGGIGDQIQKQLQEKVRDFVDGSVSAVQKRIADKLKSSETSAMLGKRRREAFLQALGQTEAEVAALIERGPQEQIERMVPQILQHNRARAELREAIRAEVEAVLAELATQTVGELLDEVGLRDWARQGTLARGAVVLGDFTRTPGFAAWWAAVHPAP
jgi:histone H3/H4